MITVAQVTPVFHVADLARSLAFYREVLGFGLVFRWGEPAYYAGVEMHGVIVHLNADANAADRRGKGTVYLFVEEGVDEYHALIVSRGARIVGAPPQRYDYGLRDFKLADPDGNWIVIGQQEA